MSPTTVVGAFCKIMRAYHDQEPLTLDEFDRAIEALPPEAHVMRGDGVIDVRMSLAAAWRHIWRDPPVYRHDGVEPDEVLPQFAERVAPPHELD